MKLTTVLSAVNNNPNYYKFIPKQIIFWKKFNINFIAVFVGISIPDELINYSSNIILWDKNLDLVPSYVAQNIRIYYPSLLHLPDDEIVMITDMDMLPGNDKYYKEGLENFDINDFIYYRYIDQNEEYKQIYMCYNGAHPSLWAKLFKINSEEDIEKTLFNNYHNNYDYDGIPGCKGWFQDQIIMYNNLHNYDNLKILNRPLKRLHSPEFIEHLNKGDTLFISEYDDIHFHRSFFDNESLILNAEEQLNKIDILTKLDYDYDYEYEN